MNTDDQHDNGYEDTGEITSIRAHIAYADWRGPDFDTLGKTVTLERGRVVTDIGGTDLVRTVRADDGTTEQIIARVIRELPETLRRDSFRYSP